MKSREAELTLLYLCFDLVLLNLSIIIAGTILLGISFENFIDLGAYLMHGNLAWILTYFIFSKRNLYLRDGYFNRIWRITKRTLIFLIVASVLAFLMSNREFSRAFFIKYSFLFWAGKIVFYWLLYKFLKYKRKKGLNTIRVLIVGINDTASILKQIINSNYSLGYQFVGFASNEKSNDPAVLGETNHLEKIIKQHSIQMVWVTLSLNSAIEQRDEQLKICNQLGIRLRFIPENQLNAHFNSNSESLGELMLINPQQIPLDNIGSRVGKRIFDIIFSLSVILLIFSWLFPILVLLIKTSSKGPVFFVQKRTGINNKTFKCIKFRSMKTNMESENRQASVNDDRITPIGQFMRKTNLDELPQFFNVLAGQMSVVGPRPHMLKHTEQYSKLIDHYLARHYVKPGITGWAQVNGYRGETKELWKMEKRIKYDLKYMETWSFILDLKIIAMTIFGIKSYSNAG